MLNSFYDKEKDTIRALLYVARADLYLRKPEKEIIYKVMIGLGLSIDISYDEVEEFLRRVDTITFANFKACVNRLAKKDLGRLELVHNISLEIVNTESTVSLNEGNSLIYIKEKIDSVS